VEIWNVASALTEADHEVTMQEWGMHNKIITHIKKDGLGIIPDDAVIGYDYPRVYLSAEIVKLLDAVFPSETPYIFSVVIAEVCHELPLWYVQRPASYP
jgi:hypothetical protein